MKPFYNSICRFALVSMMVLPMLSVSKPSFANVTITPTLVVIEGRERFADVNLLNITGATHTYAITWKFMKMVGVDGAYLNADKSITDFDLTKNIVYTPKRVTIDGGGMQKIRLGLRLKGAPPAPGDYRAHLELIDIGSPDILPIQPPAPQDLARQPMDGERQITAGVKVNVGFAIPVVYRVGESTAKPVFGTITMGIDKLGRPEVSVPVTKVGGEAFGVMGQILIYYNDKKVGEVRNANIFPEISNRIYKIPLNIEKLSGGSVRVVYKHYDANNQTVYAEKTIPVSK